MAGGLDGCASWAIVHPVDVLKTAGYVLLL